MCQSKHQTACLENGGTVTQSVLSVKLKCLGRQFCSQCCFNTVSSHKYNSECVVIIGMFKMCQTAVTAPGWYQCEKADLPESGFGSMDCALVGSSLHKLQFVLCASDCVQLSKYNFDLQIRQSMWELGHKKHTHLTWMQNLAQTAGKPPEQPGASWLSHVVAAM
jgi:hypothetical protein